MTEFVTAQVHALIRGVHRDLCRRVELELHGVRGRIRATHLPLEIGQRARQQIQIAGDGRRQERQGHANARAGKLVAGGGRSDSELHLIHGWHVVRLGSGEAEGLSVHADEPSERLRGAGPVVCHPAREPVVKRPDAEVRVVSD